MPMVINLLKSECAVRSTPLMMWKSPLWKRVTISVRRSGHFWGKSSLPMMLMASLNCRRTVNTEKLNHLYKSPFWLFSCIILKDWETMDSKNLMKLKTSTSPLTLIYSRWTGNRSWLMWRHTCFWICSGLLNIKCTMLALIVVRSGSEILFGSSSIWKQY